MNERVPVQSTQRTFTIVETLHEQEGATFSDLVSELELPESTVHDYLRSLRTLGYVVKSEGEYRVGTKFLELGDKARKQKKIYRVALPELVNLAEETGEHASLTIEENGLGVLLHIEKGENAVEIGETTGEHLPLTITAPGKAILAHLPEERVGGILDKHGFLKRTESSITSRDALFDQVETIRDRGYATEMGEAVNGVRAMAVPIRSEEETVEGAITVGGPTNRMSGEWFKEDLPDLLLRSANVVEVNFSNAP
jgi:DNA-binding IclR family transcriptional regulator